MIYMIYPIIVNDYEEIGLMAEALNDVIARDISTDDICTWIADYACKYRLRDILDELFGENSARQFPINNIPVSNLKVGLIWHTILTDEKDKYEDAIVILNSFINDTIESSTLELYLRLALGLRLKDLVHGLSLPLTVFNQRLERLFPDGKFQLEEKNLSQVFGAAEMLEFEVTVRDVCNYFSSLARAEQEKTKLLANYSESMYGRQLSESLTNVAQTFFDQLHGSQPQNMLEQIIQAGPDVLVQENTSVWNKWLASKLSDIKTLKPEHVKDLLGCLYRHRKEKSDHNQLKGSNSPQKQRRRVVEEEKDVEKGSAVQEVSTEQNAEETIDSDFVPSSQGNEKLWIHDKGCSDSAESDTRDYCVPDLRQFLKPSGVKGCTITLQRI